ncbi:MAG: hypothetical protein K5930_12340 [Treponemataceae bacterium]|nr:hypothetical protein [Treponemataceae bacterium]
MKISIEINNGKSTNKISATLENNFSDQAFTRLCKVEGLSQAELMEILGEGGLQGGF